MRENQCYDSPICPINVKNWQWKIFESLNLWNEIPAQMSPEQILHLSLLRSELVPSVTVVLNWKFLNHNLRNISALCNKRGQPSFPIFLSKVKAAALHRLTALCMPQLTWAVLYTPWGMLSKNLAWWQPDNSIHLIYPLDSTDLLWQSITLTISFPPGGAGRGGYTRGGCRVGQKSPTQLDRVYVWPRSMPATCPDISKHLVGGADISICPLEKR